MRPFDGRRLAYGALLAAFGAALFTLVPRSPGALVAGAAWAGFGYLFVGLTYLADRPGWLGKRPDGSQSPVAWVLAGPFLGAVWLAWQLRRALPESAWHEIAPGLFLGRRCAPHELPPSLEVIVDLTAELPTIGAPRAVYPVLDGCAPAPDRLGVLVDGLSARTGRIFVHCLAGHARSATVMAALLLARGLAQSPGDALAKVKSVRRNIRVSPAQRAALESWWAQERSRRGTRNESDRLNR